jgi:hypothetical protein
MRPELTHSDPTQIPQDQLIQKFIRYIEIKKRTPYSDKAKQIAGNGLCFGFSIAHAYMAAKGHVDWWEGTLKKIVRWDETESSLQGEEGRMLDGLMHRAVNYVLYNFANPDVSGVENIQQINFLKPGGLFFSEAGGIITYAITAGNLSSTDLGSLFIESVFSQEAIYLISSLVHVCSVRYTNNAWYFYDPNYKKGQKAFAHKNDLLNEIIAVLGNALIITIASWKKEADIHLTSFHAAYLHLLSSDLVGLMTNQGFNALARFGANQIETIVKLAATNKVIRANLAKALAHERPDGFTNWDMITSRSPHELSDIIALAKTDQMIRDSVGAALAHQTKNGFTGLYFTVGCVPQLLAEMTSLAYECADFNEHFTTALRTKDLSGKTLLETLFFVAPVRLFGITKLLMLGDKLSQTVKHDLRFCRNEHQQRQLIEIKKNELRLRFFKNHGESDAVELHRAELDALKAQLDYRKAIYKIRLGIDDPHLASCKAIPNYPNYHTPLHFFHKNSRVFLMQKLEATEAIIKHINALKNQLHDSSAPRATLSVIHQQAACNGNLGQIYKELLALDAKHAKPLAFQAQ